LRFFITPDQRSDYTKALDLVESQTIKALLGDKGYDADYIVTAADSAKAVIPPRSMRKAPRDYDKILYGTVHKVVSWEGYARRFFS
jgi:hypothetical protein